MLFLRQKTRTFPILGSLFVFLLNFYMGFCLCFLKIHCLAPIDLIYILSFVVKNGFGEFPTSFSYMGFVYALSKFLVWPL